jgi:hypothetical protein
VNVVLDVKKSMVTVTQRYPHLVLVEHPKVVTHALDLLTGLAAVHLGFAVQAQPVVEQDVTHSMETAHLLLLLRSNRQLRRNHRQSRPH